VHKHSPRRKICLFLANCHPPSQHHETLYQYHLCATVVGVVTNNRSRTFILNQDGKRTKKHAMQNTSHTNEMQKPKRIKIVGTQHSTILRSPIPVARDTLESSIVLQKIRIGPIVKSKKFSKSNILYGVSSHRVVSHVRFFVQVSFFKTLSSHETYSLLKRVKIVNTQEVRTQPIAKDKIRINSR
jgi:hypothetical protein